MLDFNAICRFWLHLARIELPSEIDFDCYLSWPDILLEVIAFLRCLILMVFVVAGSTFESHCSPSMLDSVDICGVPEHLAILLFVFEAWLCCYLSWPEVLLEVIAFLRCLILTLFVVAGHLLEVIACLETSTLNAICRGLRYFCKSLLCSEVDFQRYLWCSRALGHFIVCIRCLILTLFAVVGATFQYFWRGILR